MLKIIICGNDDLFSQMLKCELVQMLDESVLKSAFSDKIELLYSIFEDREQLYSKLESGEKNELIFIADADCIYENDAKHFSKLVSFLWEKKIHAVFYGKSDVEKYIKNGDAEIKTFLKRPFLTEDFCALVSEMISSVFVPHLESKRDELVVNEKKRILYFGQNSVKLTKKEYELFVHLYLHKNKICSRKDLKNQIWKTDSNGQTNIVDVYINYLRKKLFSLFGKDIIICVRQQGYMLEEI